MRPESLAALVEADRAAGLTPFFVCATRGTTSSMAFDPTAEIATICQRCRRLAARRRGDGRDRRPRARASLGQRRSRAWPTATARTRTSGWGSTSTAICTGPPTARPARGVEHPARVPAFRRRSGRRSRRPARLAGSPRAPVPRPQAVVRPAPRRRRGVPGADPPPRRADRNSSPPGSPPTIASRSSPPTRSTSSACDCTTTPPRNGSSRRPTPRTRSGSRARSSTGIRCCGSPSGRERPRSATSPRRGSCLQELATEAG